MRAVLRGVVRPLFLAYLAAILVVLYFPFVIMGILSFQGPRGGHTFPLRGDCSAPTVSAPLGLILPLEKVFN